jgi:hypothetical protein
VGRTHVCGDEEVKMIKDWFSGLAADFYNAGIWKLINIRNQVSYLYKTTGKIIVFIF